MLVSSSSATVIICSSFTPLCVAPEYQRHKLGKLLIEHSFDVARKMGYDANVNFGIPVITSAENLSVAKRKMSVLLLTAISRRHFSSVNLYPMHSTAES